MLTGEALSLYRTISSGCTSLEDSRVRLEAEFMSVTRQNAARRELESLDFRATLSTSSSPLEALEDIRTATNRVNTQCPESYQGDKVRTNFLRGALQRETWAADPIARADGDD
jgi:hypothetical protein